MIQIRNIKQPVYSSSQQNIKFNNTALLFNTIRDRMPISRAELAKVVNLSPSTVSNLVDNLLREGWIKESTTDGGGCRGRKAIMLEINAARGYIVTIELLSRSYICTLYDIRLKKIKGIRIRDTLYDSANINETILWLLRECHINTSMLLGIHMIFPGVVDPVSGDLIRSAAIPEEEIIDRHLVLQLKKCYPNAYVMISTNGTVIAFEEYISQEHSAALPLLSLNIDEAIFGGMVMSEAESNLYFCLPIEIGHLVVDFNGGVCKCGNRGCLETLCTTPVLLKRIREATEINLKCSEAFGADCNLDAIREIAKQLQEGNPSVEKVIREYVRILCSGLSSTINMFHIRCIQIGGDIALLGPPFLKMIQETLTHEFCLLDDTYPTQVGLFVSDYEQTRIAAVTMCIDSLFRQ